MVLSQIIGDPIITDPLQGLLATIFAFFVGIISSALGVGGGFITTPSLIILGIGEAYAVGTALFMIIFTALSSTVAYSRQKGLTEYKTGLLIATTTILGSIAGGFASSELATINPELFRFIFAVCLIPIAIKMIVYPKERRSGSNIEEEITHDDIIFLGFERREWFVRGETEIEDILEIFEKLKALKEVNRGIIDFKPAYPKPPIPNTHTMIEFKSLELKSPKGGNEDV